MEKAAWRKGSRQLEVFQRRGTAVKEESEKLGLKVRVVIALISPTGTISWTVSHSGEGREGHLHGYGTAAFLVRPSPFCVYAPLQGCRVRSRAMCRRNLRLNRPKRTRAPS